MWNFHQLPQRIGKRRDHASALIVSTRPGCYGEFTSKDTRQEHRRRGRDPSRADATYHGEDYDN